MSAAGGVAREAIKPLLAPGVEIKGYMVADGRSWTLIVMPLTGTQSTNNPFWIPQGADIVADNGKSTCQDIRKAHRIQCWRCCRSRGSQCSCRNLGAPVYGKLDTDLAAAMMSINAVKGVEIGEGMAAAAPDRYGQCR